MAVWFPQALSLSAGREDGDSIMHEAFGALKIDIADAIVELRQAAADAGRKQTKSQKEVTNLKLTTQRTAAREHTANVRIELEAKAEAMVRRAIMEMSEDGGKALMEAYTKIDELENGLTEVKATFEEGRQQLMEVQAQKAAFAGKLTKAEVDLRKVHEEMGAVRSTLTQVLKDLGLFRDEEAGLVDQVRILLDAFEENKQTAALLQRHHAGALERRDQDVRVIGLEISEGESSIEHLQTQHAAEIKQLRRDLARMTAERNEALTAMEELSSGSMDTFNKARAEVAKLREEIDAASTLLASGIPNTQDWNLDEHIRTLIDAYDAEKGTIASAEAAISAAPMLIGPESGQMSGKSLAERIGYLISGCDQARSEEDQCRRAMDKALMQNATLTTQVGGLLSQVADLTDTLARQQGGAQAAALRQAQADLQAEREECAGLRQQVVPLRVAVESLTADNAKLATDYYSARDALEQANQNIDALVAKLDWTVKTARERIQRTDDVAVARVNAIEDHARRERSSLITSAVHALQALGTHLTHTLVGLRTISAGGHGGAQLLKLISPHEPLTPMVQSPPGLRAQATSVATPAPPSRPSTTYGQSASPRKGTKAASALLAAPPTGDPQLEPFTGWGKQSPRPQLAAAASYSAPIARRGVLRGGGMSTPPSAGHQRRRAAAGAQADFTLLPELLTTPRAVLDQRNGPERSPRRPQTAHAGDLR